MFWENEDRSYSSKLDLSGKMPVCFSVMLEQTNSNDQFPINST